MSNAVLPNLPGQDFPVTRDSEWKSVRQENYAGKEVSISRWSYPRWHWTMKWAALREGTFNSPTNWTEYDQLVGFFNLMRGPWDTFLYSDPDDNFVTLQALGTATAAQTVFPLIRTFGGFTEPMNCANQTSPVLALTIVKKNGTTVPFGGSAGQWQWFNNALGYPGQILFNTALSAGDVITMSYGYYFVCRFESAIMSADRMVDNLYEGQELKFYSVK